MSDNREYKVTLRVDQDLIFIVDGAEDAADAYRIAVSRWQDGDVADDSGWPSVELHYIKFGDRELRFNSRLDWNGPRDARGFLPWTYWAVDSETDKTLSEGPDVAEVARRAVDAVTEVTE